MSVDSSSSSDSDEQKEIKNPDPARLSYASFSSVSQNSRGYEAIEVAVVPQDEHDGLLTETILDKVLETAHWVFHFFFFL